MLRRLLCLARGGHKWETSSDPAGAVTTCVKCGAVQHDRGGIEGTAPGHGHGQGGGSVG
jgi:hypothetical protein